MVKVQCVGGAILHLRYCRCTARRPKTPHPKIEQAALRFSEHSAGAPADMKWSNELYEKLQYKGLHNANFVLAYFVARKSILY